MRHQSQVIIESTDQNLPGAVERPLLTSSFWMNHIIHGNLGGKETIQQWSNCLCLQSVLPRYISLLREEEQNSLSLAAGFLTNGCETMLWLWLYYTAAEWQKSTLECAHLALWCGLNRPSRQNKQYNGSFLPKFLSIAGVSAWIILQSWGLCRDIMHFWCHKNREWCDEGDELILWRINNILSRQHGIMILLVQLCYWIHGANALDWPMT